MAQSILVFDFGKNEEAAQQARHKFEAWKQAFRLGDKAVLKFERKENEADAGAEASATPEAEKSGKGKTSEKKGAKGKSSAAKEENSATEAADVRILIRLNFSDHEKLSHQRWIERIPLEEPFKSAASNEILRHSDPSFAKTAELFDSLD